MPVIAYRKTGSTGANVPPAKSPTRERELSDDLPKLSFDEELHIYRIDGQRVPSVSDILENVSREFYEGAPPRSMQDAADRGTNTHLAIQLLNEGRLDESTIDPRIAPYVDAYRMFRAEKGFRPDYAEVHLGHWRQRYAGTPDMIGVIGMGRRGKPIRCIIDIKTTYQLLPVVGLQLAGYEMLWNYNQDNPRYYSTERYALHLMRDGDYKLDHFDDPGDATTFIGLVHRYYWMQKHGK